MNAPEIAFHLGEGGDPTLDRSALARQFAALVAHFPRAIARVDALLVGDAAMDAAHRRAMNIAGTTDVMSFPAHDEADAGAAVEVDLIVCTDVAAREAAARGHPVGHEILLYAVHGTLHACGFRDDTEAAAAAIHAEEDRILRAGGIGSVYARSPSTTDGQGACPD